MTRNEKEFIKSAPTSKSIQILEEYNKKLDNFVSKLDFDTDIGQGVLYVNGTTEFKKSFIVYLNEKEFKTLDRHCKNITVSRSKWIKKAILKLLEEEQELLIDEIKDINGK